MITAEEKKRLKGLGIIATKQEGIFVCRTITVNGVLDEEQLRVLSEAARRFGNGKVGLTVRMTVEIQGIPYENVEPLRAYLAEHGMYSGGTGPKVRPVVCCKGTVCPHGLIDTQGLAREMHERFYVGWHDTVLPHKFKIGIGGCPNNCVKPTLNDIGIMGARFPKEGDEPAREGYRMFIGGIWGKRQRIGDPLPGIYTKEEVYDLTERILRLWMEEGKSGERFGIYLDRVGAEGFIGRITKK